MSEESNRILAKIILAFVLFVVIVGTIVIIANGQADGFGTVVLVIIAIIAGFGLIRAIIER